MVGRSGWLSPINSVADADAVLSELRKALYVVAALQGVFGAFLATRGGTLEFVGDVAFCLFAAFLLPRTRSRGLAVFVLVWAVGGAGVTLAARFGKASGGRNVFLALLVVGLTVRGVLATMRYHRLRGSRVWWRNVAIVTSLYVAAAVVVFVAGVIGFAISEAIGFEWSDAATGMWLMWFTGLSALVIYLASRRWLPLLVPPSVTT